MLNTEDCHWSPLLIINIDHLEWLSLTPTKIHQYLTEIVNNMFLQITWNAPIAKISDSDKNTNNNQTLSLCKKALIFTCQIFQTSKLMTYVILWADLLTNMQLKSTPPN